MKDHIVLLKIAKDEIKTIIQYSEMIEAAEAPENVTPPVNEIMSDEFNHALIALLLAAHSMGINIATDELSSDPNTIEVTDDTLPT